MNMKTGLVALVLPAVLSLSAADFALVEKGKPAAKIVFEQEPEKLVTDLVDRFNGHIRTITGTVLPTEAGAEAANTIKISLREPQKLEQAWTWSVTFPEEHVMRIEAGKYSLFSALMAVLEKASDCRFLGIETCMFQYEEKDTLSLPAEPLRPAPGF